jgi:hypothetical protein
MISVLVSSLSLVIIVVVTVVLVNKSIDDDSKRKSEMRKLVDQVNTVNDSAVDIETKQNTTIGGVNSSVDALRKDVATMQKDYVKKTDIADTVTSKGGAFETVAVNGKSVISHDEKDGLNFKIGDAKIAGFDAANGGKRMLIGSELSLSQTGKDKAFTEFDTTGDVFLRTETDKARLVLQNGPKGTTTGMVMKGNKVGFGAEPKYTSLDVAGNMAVMGDGIYMGADKDGKPFNAISVKDNAMTIQADKGVTFNNDVVFGGSVIMKNANIKASATDKGIFFKDGKVGVGMEPKTYPFEVAGDMGLKGDNLYMGKDKYYNVMNVKDEMLFVNKDGTLKSVNMDGNISLTNSGAGDNVDVAVPGQLNVKVGKSVNNLPVAPSLEVTTDGIYTPGKVWGNEFIGGMGTIDNVYANRSIFGNKNGDYWTIYNNNDKNLSFNPGELTTVNSTGEESGVFNISRTGDVLASGGARFIGNIDTRGNILSDGTLNARALCLRTAAEPMCLEQDDISYVKQQGASYRSGTVPASQSDITLLNQQITNLQDQITALRA